MINNNAEAQKAAGMENLSRQSALTIFLKYLHFSGSSVFTDSLSHFRTNSQVQEKASALLFRFEK